MKVKQIAYYVVLILLLLIFVGSGIYVVSYFLDSKDQMEHYDNLSAIVEQARAEAAAATEPNSGSTEPVSAEPAPTDESGETVPPEPTEPAGPTMLPEYQPLYEMNNDLVGWLKIEDTKVDYPVMQTPDNKDYYLKRNFDKERNSHGSLYCREDCDINTPSDNITIYGHHMKDGTMFGGLKKYQQKSYWEEHDTVIFDTLYEHHTYKIFAVFKTTASIGRGFTYHSFVNAEDEADFNEFIATCKKLAFYDTGITPEYGDKVICLSTCEYTQQNGRFVVAAVRVD